MYVYIYFIGPSKRNVLRAPQIVGTALKIVIIYFLFVKTNHCANVLQIRGF